VCLCKPVLLFVGNVGAAFIHLGRNVRMQSRKTMVSDAWQRDCAGVGGVGRGC
jgi:hypothetical protein